MKKLISLVLIAILTLASFSCEFGVSYEPTSWKKTQEKDYEFTNSYDEFDLALYRIGGLIEYREISLNGELINKSNTSKKFSIEKATLKANGKEYLGKEYLGKGVYSKEGEKKLIKPNETKDFSINWNFGNEELQELLRDPVELLLIVRKDDELVEISIPMTNSH